MHENGFLLCTAVQLAMVYIGGFNQRLHFRTTFVVMKTWIIGTVAAYAGTAQKYKNNTKQAGAELGQAQL